MQDPSPVEQARLSALRSFALLDTHAEAHFDAITQLAATLCEAPIALVSLVDETRQWFKSKFGLPPELTETPRSQAFCAHAIQGDELFVVRDALDDPRFCDNPLVTGRPEVRFYAGKSLADEQGHRLGTVCIIDHVPRELLPVQRRALELLAVLTEGLMRERRARVNAGHALAREKAAEEALRRQCEHVEALIAERTQDLMRAKESAERANQAKSHFVNLVSHELRAPMHAIASFADIGRTHADDPAPQAQRLRQYFERISQSTIRLTGILDNLLDLTRIEAGQIPMRLAQTDLAGLVRNCLEEYEAFIQNAGVTVQWRPAAGPVTIRCDAHSMARVISIVVSNAVRFSPRGGVIDLELTADTGRNNARLVISDAGPGMPPDRLREVFGSGRAEGLHAAGPVGGGLSISLCRVIVSAHGGRLWAESPARGGLTVNVALPTVSQDQTD